MTTPLDEGSPVPPRYATFTNRLRAALIDTAIVGGAFVAIVMLGDAAANVPGSGRVAVLVVVGLLLYEPLLVWRRGATIGHRRTHLIVVSERTGRPPGLGRALMRGVVKVIFGLPSFVTMPLSRRHQAVHDWLTRTTVRVAPGAENIVEEFHVEPPDESDVLLPSPLRRTAVGLGYLVALFIANGVAVAVIDPGRCARTRSCDPATRTVLSGLMVAWLALSLAAIVMTWKGLLWGARRRPVENAGVPLD